MFSMKDKQLSLGRYMSAISADKSRNTYGVSTYIYTYIISMEKTELSLKHHLSTNPKDIYTYIYTHVVCVHMSIHTYSL